MINNEFTREWLAKMAAATDTPRSHGQCAARGGAAAEDIANAVAWLVSDQARYITGVTLPVDAGFLNK